jgi:hypothetical protein
MNEDLKQLHEQLIAQHQALYQRLDTVDDPDQAKAIVTEMREILHRVDLVQGLLFRDTSVALKKSLDKVDAADVQLTKALKAAETAAHIINGVGKFLSFVDKAIDLAKKLGPLAAGI